MLSEDVGDLVERCAILATQLEVSAYPKPGNIHRLRDFPETSYEQFLSGGISLGPTMRKLAIAGNEAAQSSREWSSIKVGTNIHQAVCEMLKWQNGGNTHLGIILLFAPLAAAAGAVCINEKIEPSKLRKSLTTVIDSMTPDDSVEIYRGIGQAMNVKTLGEVDELDVTDKASQEQILNDNITPRQIFQKCCNRDSICSEWVMDFYITFLEGYPYLLSEINKENGLNNAVVNTFLNILAKHPDSLIQRKTSLEESIEISLKARELLEQGGACTEEGRARLFDWDDELNQSQGMFNPGTTADLTAASIFVLLLTGWRP
jgi:triphosphoribosyl-dephospho-CoA synthase